MVVSPLIGKLGFDATRCQYNGRDCLIGFQYAALMENQVEALRAKRIPADLLSSQRTESDRRKVVADIQSSKPTLRLLFVTPELLATDR